MNCESSDKGIFEIQAICPWSGARAGLLKTKHGIVETPVFMPVGTSGTLKALTFSQTEQCGASIILNNSYHLFLRPGLSVIKDAGGLHKFINWHKPILTDSGGFQVFSLGGLRKITEEGVLFKDHLSGNEHFIGPEKSMLIQNTIGADIIMAFDDCVKNPATHAEAQAAMERTHRWLAKCVEHHQRPEDQSLFGIVQGSIYEDLREASAKIVSEYNLPGYAIGGVAVGEQRSLIEQITQFTAPLLPVKKPRYLMGIGTPWDIAHAVKCGIDMFDCVMPTRLARHGAVFSGEGRLSLKSSRFASDWAPIDNNCDCYTCINHSRAYLHHLFRSKELSAYSLLSIHNLRYLIVVAQKCRKAILDGEFRQLFQDFLALNQKEDRTNRI